MPNLLLVRIHTDDGLVGCGETYYTPHAIAALIHDWMAERVLGGHRLTFDEALSVLRSPDEELLSLLAAAYRVRRHFYGDTVKLNFLINAKSGICPEDCGYCSQSRVSTAEIPKYQLLSPEQIVEQEQILRVGIRELLANPGTGSVAVEIRDAQACAEQAGNGMERNVAGV